MREGQIHVSGTTVNREEKEMTSQQRNLIVENKDGGYYLLPSRRISALRSASKRYIPRGDFETENFRTG